MFFIFKNPFATLEKILEKVTKMALDLSKLTNDVAAQKTVIDSAVTFINGVPALVAAAVHDALVAAGVDTTAAQAAADAASATIEQETASLQAALTANTTPPAP